MLEKSLIKFEQTPNRGENPFIKLLPPNIQKNANEVDKMGSNQNIISVFTRVEHKKINPLHEWDIQYVITFP